MTARHSLERGRCSGRAPCSSQSQMPRGPGMPSFRPCPPRPPPRPMVPTTCCATQVPMTLSAFKSGGAQDGLRAGNKVSAFSLPLLKGPRNQLPPQRKVRRSHSPPPSVCPRVRPSVPLSQTTSSHLRAQACFPLRSARDCARACPPDAGGVGVLGVTRASPTEQPSSPVTQPLQVTGLWGVIWL